MKDFDTQLFERDDFEESREDESVIEADVVDGDSRFADSDFGVDASAVDLPGLPVTEGTGELVRYDPFKSYLNEIKHLPKLTREEEFDLAVKYRQGDKLAGYKLVVSNLRLVVFIAREYKRNLRNILDLIQEGNIGLLQAVEQFDPYKGVRFPSYAAYWVRAYMLRFLINNIRLVKIGTTQAQRKLFFNLNKEKKKLEEQGFVPEARLLAERLQVKESEVIEMEQRLSLPDLSVDAPLSSDVGQEQGTMHSVLPSHDPSIEQQVARAELAAKIREALDSFKEQLDEKEVMIVDRRLFTDEQSTLQEIADEFGLSRERIRQIENRLKDRLKVYLMEHLDDIEVGDIGFHFEGNEEL